MPQSSLYCSICRLLAVAAAQSGTPVGLLLRCGSMASAWRTGPVRLDGHFNCGHYVSVTSTDADRRSIFGTRDNIFPRFGIKASYGNGAYDVHLGCYRDACRNLQMMRTIKETRMTIRHDSNLRDNMDSLIEDFSNLREKWGTIVEAAEKMEQAKVSLKKFLADIFTIDESASENKRGRTEKAIAKIFTRVQRERMETGRGEIGDDWEVSAWEAFNGVQGFCQHDKTRRNNPTGFVRSILADTDPICRQAEELALALSA